MKPLVGDKKGGIKKGTRLILFVETMSCVPFSFSPFLSEEQSIGRSLYRVELVLRDGSGSVSEITLLRGRDWLEDYGAHAGGSVFLSMPEMSVEGQADVLSVQPFVRPVDSGGQLTTGTFRHTSGEVYDLTLTGESESIGVTGTHPFWSVDRNEWVPAAELQPGETLRTLTSTTQVDSILKQATSEPVFNIEVNEDHVYRIGDSGVLVHNNSEGDDCDDPEDQCVKDTGNDPCWNIPGKYQYKSAKQACRALGVTPKSREVVMDSKPLECNGNGPSYHVTCNDHAPPNHDSAISCDCCDDSGKVERMWKLARHD